MITEFLQGTIFAIEQLSKLKLKSCKNNMRQIMKEDKFELQINTANNFLPLPGIELTTFIYVKRKLKRKGRVALYLSRVSPLYGSTFWPG